MHQGVVKSFVWNKGWGFITSEEQDIFFHVNDFKRGIPEAGSIVTFELGENSTRPGSQVAVNIQGTANPGSVQGVVKGFVGSTGYGFINVNDEEIFVHVGDVKCGGLKEGDIVWLDVEPSDKDPNKKVAKNVTGGSGHTDQGACSEWAQKAKGKGKDFGKAMEQMMSAMATMFSMMGPYGKGKGKGKDGKGGKPMGKGKGKQPIMGKSGLALLNEMK
eukprot:TRINITY_DN95787_c0_g1_i1.p1 TRINITY_DN95787_c0_g1~~TRINITY_DN95787_c0_g1_i1.p1  ORF type:complete len:217 (-),score=59.50 TRINITY_DN95787_c0_g1_i1:88-738(-)